MQFETLARDVVSRITYKPGYQVVLAQDTQHEGGRFYYQAHVERIDIVTKELGTGKGGKAYLSPHMTISELVRLAFGLLLSYEEHECREHFKFDGLRVFGPHIDVNALKEVARRIDVRKAPIEDRLRRAELVSLHLRQCHSDDLQSNPDWEKLPVEIHETIHLSREVIH